MTSIGYRFYKVTLAGIVPLILHNGQLADPLNPFSKALKAASSRRKKTDADLEKMADIEWRGSLYTNAAGRVVIPGRVLESMIVTGAKRSKDGKTALSGVFVESDALLEFRGQNKTIEEMQTDPEFRIAVPVRVNTSRVIRTRPIFHDWSATFEVSAAVDVVADAAQLRQWIEAAGNFSGLCDWRPRYGRFAVTDFVEMAVELPKAA